MEAIVSRKNKIIKHIRDLSTSASYRRNAREFVCDGHKLLREAIDFGAKVNTVLWRERAAFELSAHISQYTAPSDLFEYASPLKNSPGPVFVLEMPEKTTELTGKRVIVLEGVQDPGNVGTVIRTANALGFDAVILVGGCADIYNPKTIRATMGALFRQCVIVAELSELKPLLASQNLALYGAALSETAIDLRKAELNSCAVAIGSEGSGLTPELLKLCDGQLIIPMRENSESFNAAIAASIIMWETARCD